jgi:hypothetical protein
MIRGNERKDYSKVRSLIGIDRQKVEISITQKDRQRGLYIIGTNGTGKSNLIANLIVSDIEQGMGVCLIEPHGDLTNLVLSFVPKHRLKDVILLDMTDSEHPFGLNLFECTERTIEMQEKTVDFVQHVFEKVWGTGTETPRLSQVLRAVTRTLIENPGTTFAEVPLLFSNDTVRAKMLANLTNDSVVSFWEDYNHKSYREREEYIESTKNKVKSFLDSTMVRNIIGQSKTTIDFRRIMDEEKILLVKLSPQFKEVSLLIGAIIIGKLLMASYSREKLKPEDRLQFNLYCDEYQRFATSDLKTLINEARKFRVAITLAHQTLSQLDRANWEAATGAANMIVLRVTGEDGKTLAKSFDTTPTKEIIGEDPIRAPVSDVISQLVKRGYEDSRVARFAQVYLKNLENFVSNPPRVGIIPTTPANKRSDYAWMDIFLFEYSTITKAREELNQCLYDCMVEKNSLRYIPPLALYMLAVAQQDSSDQVFNPYIYAARWAGDNYFRGFEDVKGASADAFGDPYFLTLGYASAFISSRLQKGFFGSVTRQSQREMESARAFVDMLTELRYTMDKLAERPILVDTGQYQPKYQNRPYADMENEIARDLTQMPLYHARVKLVEGEAEIKTVDPLPDINESNLDLRITLLQRQMIQLGYCRDYKDVEKEIRERQERWRSSGSEEPPPTYY